MKTITKISYALFLGFTLSLASCSDDDGGSTGGTPSGEYVKAKIDGSDFKSSTSYDFVAASGGSTNLTVQGSDNSGNVIQLILTSFNGEGTYSVNEASTQGSANYSKFASNTLTSYSSAAGHGANGEITVTLIDDTKVEGTFKFKGRKNEEGSTEMVNVTDGSFRANLQ